ncbi:MAG: cytochrome C oxidase subunit IV family protein [Polyangiaceae bacterium]|nr:cytochrome C oxidase subunit IV family protein [Polyangiaceae bacterium]
MTDEEKRPEGEDNVASSEDQSAVAEEHGVEADQNESQSDAGQSDAVQQDAAEPEADSEENEEEHDAHDGDHHGPHITPKPLLLGVLGALIVLTVLTVGVTAIDLGSEGNFVVAMVIATIKAVLVMAFFMHLAWDKKFNVVVFCSSFLFVLLFLSMSLLDRSEYQSKIDHFSNDNAPKELLIE